MAKIQILTKSSRGRAVCSRCGKEIYKGEKYNKATPFRRKPIVRCLRCGLKPYETSGSSYIRQIGSLIYNWEKSYCICDTVVDDILSDVEAIRDDIECSLYNLPEQFQDDSILQERLDGLEDCISDLKSIDTSFYDDLDEDNEDYYNELKMNEAMLKADIGSALSNLLLR